MRKVIIILSWVTGFIVVFLGFILVTGYFDDRRMLENFYLRAIAGKILLYQEKYATFPPNLETYVQAAVSPGEQFVNVVYPGFFFVKEKSLRTLYNPEPDLSNLDQLSHLIVAGPLTFCGRRKCIFLANVIPYEYNFKPEIIPESDFQKYWQIGDDSILHRRKAEAAQ